MIIAADHYGKTMGDFNVDLLKDSADTVEWQQLTIMVDFNADLLKDSADKQSWITVNQILMLTCKKNP